MNTLKKFLSHVFPTHVQCLCLCLVTILLLGACSQSDSSSSTANTVNLSETVNGYTFVVNNTSQSVDSTLKVSVIPDNTTTTYNFGFKLYTPGEVYWNSNELVGTIGIVEGASVSGNVVRYLVPVAAGSFDFEPRICIDGHLTDSIVASANFEITVQ